MFHLVSFIGVIGCFHGNAASTSTAEPLGAAESTCVALSRSLSPSLIPTQFPRRSMTQKSIKVYLAAVAATEIPPIVSCVDGRYCAHVFLSTFTLPELVLKKNCIIKSQVSPSKRYFNFK